VEAGKSEDTERPNERSHSVGRKKVRVTVAPFECLCASGVCADAKEHITQSSSRLRASSYRTDRMEAGALDDSLLLIIAMVSVR